MSKETLALIFGIIGVLLVFDGAISLARFVVTLCKRSKTLSITSEDLDIIHEALEAYQESFRDFQADYPDEMSDEELERNCNRVRSVDTLVDTIKANSPLIVEVKQA